ncbi:MAG TPA: BMP family ABC transporter substrate-binding protein [Burkholderiaceae bacterium]|nr:BMP family ABC transporter substrate-binding protein [Burkholderiaceae bacterium]
MGIPALGLGTMGSTSAQQGNALKVGVVYVSPVSETGWTRQHDLGRQAIETAFPGKVTTTAIANVFSTQDTERVMRELAEQGHGLIFGTSFSHMTPIVKVARDFPHVKFEHCSGLQHAANLGTFEARYYEGGFLSGVAAGAMTKSNVIGFVGGFPVPDVVATVNAILLGARSVNPKTICRVVWLNSWYDPGKEQEAATALMAAGADVLVSMTDTAATAVAAESRGKWSIGYASDFRKFAPKGQLTSFTLDWSSIYVEAARAVLEKRWVSRARWEGIQPGIVKMAPWNPAIPSSVLATVRANEAAFQAGTLQPFTGPINDHTGKPRVARGQTLASDDLRKMNWLVEGVQGTI